MLRADDIVDVIPDPVVVIAPDARLRWANSAAADRFGWTLAELVGLDVSALVHPDDLVTAMSSLASVQQRAVGSLITIRLRDRSGAYATYEVRGRSALDDARIGGVVLALRDVTDRARWDIDGGVDAVSRTILQYAPGITMVLSPDGTIRGATRAFTSVLGHDLESTLGTPLHELAVGDDRALVLSELRAVVADGRNRSFEASVGRRDAPPVPLQLTVVNLLDDPSVRGLVVTALEISALVEARERLHYQASYDQLTGLVNRRYLRELLDEQRGAARRNRTNLAVVYCDIDGFKVVNDGLGHRAGDEVLVEVARRLRAALRDGDIVARYGGDEFIIVLPGAGPVEASSVVGRLAAALDRPVRLSNGSAVDVRLSAGYSVDDGTSDLDNLLAHADVAMYEVKRVRS